jgi:CelD/BcsL family acetyltransferase involved in cellulose biosynthesis
MQVRKITDLAELEFQQARWDELAGDVPFRSWLWNRTWWKHYGHDHELTVLCVYDGSKIVGIAPWYVYRSPVHGRVVSFLGSGEVCSEYTTILAPPGAEAAVAEVLADWLEGGGRSEPSRESSSSQFDQLHFDCVSADDVAVHALLDLLGQRNFTTWRRPAPARWRLQLQPSWEEYLAMLSKSHRKQLRRAEKEMLQTGRANFRTLSDPQEFDEAFATLVRLHQRRWQNQGKPGCFSSQQFLEFHRDVAHQLLSTGQLRLHILEIDNQPAASEYHFCGGTVIYAYQSGLEPSLSSYEPGRLAAIGHLQLAINEGFCEVDFLRGDEPYKAHFRASPNEAMEIRAVHPRLAAQMRFRAWDAASRVKHAVGLPLY